MDGSRLSLAARRVLATQVAVILTVTIPAVPADATANHGDRSAPPSWLRIENGVTQPVFRFADAITDSVHVETEVDSDRDGSRDRVHLQVFRPEETRTRNIKVPVILEDSPYRFGTGEVHNHEVDVDTLPQEPVQPRDARHDAAALKAAGDPSGSLEEYWVPRGYAVVLAEGLGTGSSDGCPTVGDMTETLGVTAVIDWLTGRARAWNDSGEPIRADWSTGAVGMIGSSYDGTLANMAATTGVPGLRTIVPISAIASWYDYYRANGLVRAPHSQRSGASENVFQGEDVDVLAAFVQGESRSQRCARVTAELRRRQDRVTGDYSTFWHERDYLHRAGGVNASVLVVHGIEDYNVMPKAYASWWAQLSRHGVPRKIWLHRGGHSRPADAAAFQRTLNQWFDHWLFGVRNGIMREPTARVERPDGTYDRYPDWPVPGARPAALRLGADSATAPGTLSTRHSKGGRTPQSFVDRGRELDTDDHLVRHPDAGQPNRLVYLSPVLARDVHVSGTPRVELLASVDNRRAANLTAVLVEYGPPGSTAAPVAVTRGWLDPQNRIAVSRGRPLDEGRAYRLGWDLQPDDHVFRAGRRIGLVVVSTDFDYTLRPLPGTELAVYPAGSRLLLPAVGGASSLGF